MRRGKGGNVDCRRRRQESWDQVVCSGALVAPPADFVAAAFGGGDDVEAAVAVDVGGDDHVGVGPAVLEELHVPGAAGVAAVFEVGDAAGDVPGGCDDFDVAVVVEVGGDGFEGVGEAFTDYVLAPFACGGLAVVFVPDDLVMFESHSESARPGGACREP